MRYMRLDSPSKVLTKEQKTVLVMAAEKIVREKIGNEFLAKYVLKAGDSAWSHPYQVEGRRVTSKSFSGGVDNSDYVDEWFKPSIIILGDFIQLKVANSSLVVSNHRPGLHTQINLRDPVPPMYKTYDLVPFSFLPACDRYVKTYSDMSVKLHDEDIKNLAVFDLGVSLK